MPPAPFSAVVFSNRSLVLGLLGELLRLRAGARRLTLCTSIDEALANAHRGQLMVCDVHGVPPAAMTAFLERLHASRPALRVVMLDEARSACSVDEILLAVRSAGLSAPEAHEALTPIETQVMLAVAAGGRNADIARRMRRSFKTVEKHRASAMRKLGLRNVAQLTAYAIRHNLLEVETVLESRGESVALRTDSD